MKRLFLCVAITAFVLVGVGCTSHQPMASFQEYSLVRADFESNNFKVIAAGLQAEASSRYVLYGLSDMLSATGEAVSSVFNPGAAREFAAARQGMRGIALDDPAVLEKAMKQLREKAKMTGKSAILHNVHTEWVTKGYVGIYGTRTVSITADVVEFTGDYVDYKDRP